MKILIETGKSFDFEVSDGENGPADHKFVESLGYEVKMAGDCSFYAPGLNGISLSSYGNWGTFFNCWMDNNAREVAIKMIDEGIVDFYRYR